MTIKERIRRIHFSSEEELHAIVKDDLGRFYTLCNSMAIALTEYRFEGDWWGSVRLIGNVPDQVFFGVRVPNTRPDVYTFFNELAMIGSWRYRYSNEASLETESTSYYFYHKEVTDAVLVLYAKVGWAMGVRDHLGVEVIPDKELPVGI